MHPYSHSRHYSLHLTTPSHDAAKASSLLCLSFLAGSATSGTTQLWTNTGSFMTIPDTVIPCVWGPFEVLGNAHVWQCSGHQWAVVALAHLITAMRGPLLVLVPPRRCHDGLWSVLRMLLLLASLQVSAGTGKIENDWHMVSLHVCIILQRCHHGLKLQLPSMQMWDNVSWVLDENGRHMQTWLLTVYHQAIPG